MVCRVAGIDEEANGAGAWSGTETLPFAPVVTLGGKIRAVAGALLSNGVGGGGGGGGGGVTSPSGTGTSAAGDPKEVAQILTVGWSPGFMYRLLPSTSMYRPLEDSISGTKLLPAES